MKPCSAYCRPTEGLHTFLVYVPRKMALNSNVVEVEAFDAADSCVEVGLRIRGVAAEPAREAPPSPNRDRHPVLLTVEVVS